LQVSLLRALQEREIRRVGGRRSIAVDVRVVAATHDDLAALVEQGTFRQDLFYRLNIFPIRLPALRERRDDIVRLAQPFRIAIATREKIPAPELTAEVLRRLAARDWPGNVRELQSVLERAMALGGNGSIEGDHL